jgi:hypothetical protein
MAAKRKAIGSKAPAPKMEKALQPGDRVSWQTSQGKTTGRVVKKVTKPTKIKTHKVAASKAAPQYIVKSEKSGKRAAHKPRALKKKR